MKVAYDQTKNPFAEPSPFMQATLAGDAGSMRLLLDRGADIKAIGGLALSIAVTVNCSQCVDLLVSKNLDKDAYTFALLTTAFLGDTKAIRLMLDHGADVNVVDPLGRTTLMYAALSDLMPVEAVKLLIEHGANVNAKSSHARSADTGQSVLDIAKLYGQAPIVDLLVKAWCNERWPCHTRAAAGAWKHDPDCDSTKPSVASALRRRFYFEVGLHLLPQQQSRSYDRWSCTKERIRRR